MTPDVVVDVGNTRIKWGRAAGDAVARVASLPEDEAAWEAQADAWGLRPPLSWALASVRPARCDRLRDWLESRGDRVTRLTAAAQLPLSVGLAEPDKAGIDRLLNAIAARRRLPPGTPAVLIDAGSAVTIDWLDEAHVFRGGLIAPGLDLMAKALNSYTALLPVVEVTVPIPELPAGRTTTAMQAGIFHSVAGCVRSAVRLYSDRASVPPVVFFTGGQARTLLDGMGDEARGWHWWPEQTLVGILDSVRGAP